MSAFLIAQHDVGDPSAFQECRAKVIPIVERRGGRFVVRSKQAADDWDYPGRTALRLTRFQAQLVRFGAPPPTARSDEGL